MSRSAAAKQASKSNQIPALPDKPAKFPLTPHRNGKWVKKIHGKIRYFGNWYRRSEGKIVRVDGDGRKEAQAEYDRFIFEQLHGHQPVEAGDTISVGKLCNLYLESKQKQLDAGELGQKTFHDYTKVCDLIVNQFGGPTLVEHLGPFDFEKLRARMTESWGPTRLGNQITYTRGVFKYGSEMGLLDKPVVYGQCFDKPSAAVQRKHRATGGEKMFTALEIHELLDGRKKSGDKPAVGPASVQVRAMILLGVNGAMINSDIGSLPLSSIDWKNKLIDFPRPKNGIARTIPLWPETVAALKAAIDERPESTTGLAFVTYFGNAWHRPGTDAVGQEFNKRMELLHINGRRGLGFASLRHCFQTVADETLDFPSIKRVMGHTTKDISARYRERIDSKRLVAVTDYVRAWFLAGKPKAAKKSQTPKKPK
jgi:integrase